jgi:hypothetical protein
MTSPKMARRQHLAPKPTAGVIGPSFDQVANRARRDTRFVPVRARSKAVAWMERDRREPMTGYSRALFIPVTFRVRNATVE